MLIWPMCSLNIFGTAGMDKLEVEPLPQYITLKQATDCIFKGAYVLSDSGPNYRDRQDIPDNNELLKRLIEYLKSGRIRSQGVLSRLSLPLLESDDGPPPAIQIADWIRKGKPLLNGQFRDFSPHIDFSKKQFELPTNYWIDPVIVWERNMILFDDWEDHNIDELKEINTPSYVIYGNGHPNEEMIAISDVMLNTCDLLMAISAPHRVGGPKSKSVLPPLRDVINKNGRGRKSSNYEMDKVESYLVTQIEKNNKSWASWEALYDELVEKVWLGISHPSDRKFRTAFVKSLCYERVRVRIVTEFNK
jgi:hypothetical protein